jgi:inorganic pyrophosphatase
MTEKVLSKTKAHPWHGITPGSLDIVTAFIEIVPTDTVKYEIDKTTGFLRVDRPQRYSNRCPALYGFIPQTYCGAKIGALCAKKTGKTSVAGDDDPLDILVLTEQTIPRGDIILDARPIGGFCLIDKGEADDKIIAVLKDDLVFGEMNELADLPSSVVDRLAHYFLTYKQIPGSEAQKIEIASHYGKAEAQEVIAASLQDYRNLFGEKE